MRRPACWAPIPCWISSRYRGRRAKVVASDPVSTPDRCPTVGGKAHCCRAFAPSVGVVEGTVNMPARRPSGRGRNQLWAEFIRCPEARFGVVVVRLPGEVRSRDLYPADDAGRFHDGDAGLAPRSCESLHPQSALHPQGTARSPVVGARCRGSDGEWSRAARHGLSKAEPMKGSAMFETPFHMVGTKAAFSAYSDLHGCTQF